MRSLSLLFIASWSVLLLGCQSTPQGKVIEDLSREQLGVSILSVNLLGVSNIPRASQGGVPWQTRYTRIFTWMRDTGTFPDVIVLQEATGFMQCAFDPTVRDYAAINFLRNGISSATGEQYRIAYLIVGKPAGAPPTDWTGSIPSGGCSQTNGKALLYRPSRLRNIITSPSAGEPVVSPYDVPFPLLTTYLAMSAQCCPLNLDGSDVCPVTSVMDGPMVRPRIGPVFRDTCSTRQGVAYTRSRLATQGEDRTKPFVDAVFSRFELVNQRGNYIHIYNVHRGWNEDWGNAHPDGAPAPPELDFGSQNINQLVTDMESRFNRRATNTERASDPLLYPPILVGDFNVGSRPDTRILDSYFPRFEVAAWSNAGEPDGAMFGRTGDIPNFPPAKQTPYANLVQHMPELFGNDCSGVPDKLWSDHCGLFFRVEPSRR